ncbi:E7 [Leptonychotes weddellii papillomavirus 5]|uniref:Protein E7 n=1 Tax=Leptonychotes weddellii papillomavirus 5 TaxID=2077306 RepID=A0A2I8B2Q3_9PAPI|nr:E7 [Leptonychotes weddellii papillomavirus 5]AUT11918.1 E7 [Leptonychotes weddellii papillomavirus 5]
MRDLLYWCGSCSGTPAANARSMIGPKPTIRDIDLDLREVVLPVDLLSGETLPPEEVESPPPEPERFRVDSRCGGCHTPVRLCIQVVHRTLVHKFEELLLEGLDIVCATCLKATFGSRNGGR